MIKSTSLDPVKHTVVAFESNQSETENTSTSQTHEKFMSQVMPRGRPKDKGKSIKPRPD